MELICHLAMGPEWLEAIESQVRRSLRSWCAGSDLRHAMSTPASGANVLGATNHLLQ